MKRIVCFGVAVMTLQGVLPAHAAEPQPAWLVQPVTIREKLLPEVLSIVQRIGGFTLEMNADDKERLPQSVKMRFTNARIEAILELALGMAGLSFRVVDEKTVQAFRPAVP